VGEQMAGSEENECQYLDGKAEMVVFALHKNYSISQVLKFFMSSLMRPSSSPVLRPGHSNQLKFGILSQILNRSEQPVTPAESFLQQLIDGCVGFD